MANPRYVEWHARSAFSFLEGSSLPEDLIGRAGELDMPAMLLMDRDSLSGTVRFHQAAKKLGGIRAMVGVEVTSSDGFRYPLIAETRTGYQNLSRLLTKIKLRESHGDQHQAAATFEDIAEHREGLICLTGGDEGPLAFGLQKSPEEAQRHVQQLIELFGKKNIYVELQRHQERVEEARNQAASVLARRLELPLLATNGVCHATPGGRILMDALTCVRHHVTIAEAGRLLARNSERHLKSAEEMSRLFADTPEAVANTLHLSERVTFTLENLGYQFPDYPVSEGETMDSFLRKRTEEGARVRYGKYTGRVKQQIERELALIEKLSLAGYFLIVWDIVRFCLDRGILVQGRGSAANSAVCYSLFITAVDPIGMDLLFERFLSEDRGEWPDIDLDLPSGDQRERAIQYVYERYGKLGAAMTANVITYRGRSAARDIGKVLGFDDEVLGKLSKLAPMWGWKDEKKDGADQQFKQAGLDPENPRVRQFLSLYKSIQDLPRHLGQHSGGMVICQGSLDGVVPLQPATMPGRVVVQWDKEDCADMGIVKVDLLGLGMMAVLEDTLTFIRDDYGEEIDLGRLPQDDPPVYESLRRADTVGLFQVESRAQMSCLPRLRPEKFYDLVVEVAIIRPGPIVGNMLNPYLRRRQGLEEPVCLHPSLEPVLQRTLGVPLFQEQLLKIAMIAANFTGGEAEELRRAMGFKRSEERMQEIETKLRRGMTTNGITGASQDQIVQSIASFALYGFPESHAASFALIAYASAYLKFYYLAAFTAAMLNNQPMGFYHPATLVKDAQRHGLHFKPVDASRSTWKCAIEEDAGQKCVRLGFNYIKGFRERTAQALVEERQRAPFENIRDLVRRVPTLNKEELKRLADAGALNNIDGDGSHRRQTLWRSELAIRPVGALLEQAATDREPSPLARMNAEDRMYADFRSSGITIGMHPMRLQRDRMKQMGVRTAEEVKHLRDGLLVRIAGCVICRQRPGTAKGFVFISLEDETGIANAIVTPTLFDTSKLIILNQPSLMIEGILQNQQGVVSVKAGRVEGLSFAQAVITSHDFH